MVWFIFAFLTALFTSLKDVFSKKGVKETDEYVIAWALRFFTLPFLLPLLFLIEIPKLGSQFLLALIISGGLNVVTTILYVKAIKVSDISITIPIIAFTPVFLLIVSPVILGEFPNMWGFIGVILIVLGSYVLKINKKSEGYLTPFKSLFKETGPKLMLIVAFIWSITSSYDKIGVLNSSSIFWAIIINVFIAIILTPIMIYKSRDKVKQIYFNIKFLLPIGFFGSLMSIFQMIAFKLTLVTYVISIKRASIILSVIFGFLIFKEKNIKKRLLGAIIMVIGIILITLF